MTEEVWARVDGYVNSLLDRPDEAQQAALESSRSRGLPPINVTPSQGKLLHLLAKAIKARSVLEIGTLGGYSTIWLARAIGDGGRVTTLELDPHHAEVARQNLERAGVAGVVDVVVGPALESLPALERDGRAPFDLVFIDADKVGYPQYLEWALRLTRPGGVIIADNVVRDGEVVDDETTDENVRAIRRFNEMLAAERRVSATIVQTVGGKGYDGFALPVVEQPK